MPQEAYLEPILKDLDDAGNRYKAIEDRENSMSKKEDRDQLSKEKKALAISKMPNIKVVLQHYPQYNYPDPNNNITLIIQAYYQVTFGGNIPEIGQLRDHKEEVLKKAAVAGKVFIQLDKHFEKEKLLTEEQKRQERLRLLQLHDQEIRDVLILYPDRDFPKKYRDQINPMLKWYDMKWVFQLNNGQEDILDSIQTLARKSDERSGDESQDHLNSQISDAQKNGLKEIAKWMYRNINDTGAINLAPTQERFVRMILNLPARMKLLMYYLIENKKRHKPTAEDIILSQTDYTPDLSNFKDQMIASKFKFWKRVDGSYVYWNKLEETLQIARKAVTMLEAFGNMGSPDAVGHMEQQLSQNNLNYSEQNPLKTNSVLERNVALENFVNGLKDHKNLLQQREEKKGNNQNTDQIDEDIEKSAQEIIKKYKELAFIDEKIAGEESFSESNSEKAEFYTSIGGKGLGVAGNINMVEKAASFISWHIGDLHLENLNLTSGVFNTLGGVAALVSTITGIVNLAQSGREETADEVAGKIMGIIQNFAGIASTLVKASYTLKNAKIVGDTAQTIAGKAAIASANKAGGAASIATGTLDMIGGIYQMGRGMYQSINAENIHKQMSGLDEKDQKKADDIFRLQQKIMDSKVGSGGMKAISGSLQIIGGILSMSGVASPVGAILSGIATGMSLAVSIKEYVEKKHNRTAVIDSYIKMKEIKKIVLEKIENDSRGKQVSKDDDLEDQIRSEVIACLGFSGEQTFYVHITRVYARFLIQKAFYNDQGNVITADAVKVSGENPYAKMIRTFGLKPIYPADEHQSPKPDVDSLAKKMTI